MSKLHFSEQELAFFDEGDTLSSDDGPPEDFSDLDEGERVSSWARRALALLPNLGSARGES